MTSLRGRRALALLGAVGLFLALPAASDEPAAGLLAPAVAALENGETEAAEAMLLEALAGELGTQDRAEALIYLARIQLGDGRFADADATAARAVEELARVTEPRDQAVLLALMVRFEAARAQGDDEKASGFARQIAGLTERQGKIGWAADSVPGAFVHRASGAILPEAVAGLAEHELNTYDESGLDASLTYAVDDAAARPSDTPSFVTTHITLNQGRTASEQFLALKREVMEKFPDAREISTGPIAVVQGKRRLEGTMGVFSMRANGEQGFATVHVFRLQPDITVRFTAAYPASNAETMRGRVAALMQSMVWPEGATIR
ncbi:MAG: hypothetical protein AB7O49_16460 [Sphingomonadales bacterium]